MLGRGWGKTFCRAGAEESKNGPPRRTFRGLLGGFKYSGFLIGTANSLLGTALPQPNLPLPILHRQDTRPMCTGSGHAISRNWFSESKNILRISQAFA